MSQITTHVLDTSLGKPAAGIRITLEKPVAGNDWESIASGITNADGRISDLLPKDSMLKAGSYRMTFETGTYFADQKLNSFYPVVQIIFEIKEVQHYHIPLLLSPYGYTTYRGS